MEPSIRQSDDSSCAGHWFEIHAHGHLNGKWSEWLDGLEITPLDNGEMILRGWIPDQPALMGVLTKLSRLNLDLLSVNPISQTE
jgi:hypothetical protein